MNFWMSEVPNYSVSRKKPCEMFQMHTFMEFPLGDFVY